MTGEHTIITGSFFLTLSPHFQYEKRGPTTRRSFAWLQLVFHIATQNQSEQLKKTSKIYTPDD